jgi:hypothetical protein
MREKKYSVKRYLKVLRIYRDLYKSKGLRLVIAYFLNAHLFDLKFKTDTHRIVPLEAMSTPSDNLSNSLMYMVSWTNTLRRSFKELQNIRNLSNCEFIDLGAGKGKATLFARKYHLIGAPGRYWGIDFEESLISIAKRNSVTMFGDEGNFLQEDVVNINWERFGTDLVIYMYNPFNSNVMRHVLKQIENKNVTIIYVNPVEASTILEFGYESRINIRKWHANLSFGIFTQNHYGTERPA